jgi:hypothetical protein
VTSLQANQRVPCFSTHVKSSEGWEPIQDVYCHERMGYWSYLLQEEYGKEFSVAYMS